jgi:type I restriction enzyme S subunit
MSFPRYPTYKDGGVEWLGQVPEHWHIRRVGDVAALINGYPFDSGAFNDADGHPLVRIRDLNSKETAVRYLGEWVEEAAISSRDILIGMDGDFNVGRWNGEGKALLNQRMCCLRGEADSIRFLEYALPDPLNRINAAMHSTTVKHLSSNQVRKIRVAWPQTSGELGTLVRFLDRETGKIDALVEQQETLLKQLEEKRAATISHVVLRGVNQDALLSDSNVSWAGPIPSHWKVVPFSQLAKLGRNAFIDGDWIEAPFITTEGIRLLQTGNVGVGSFKEQGFRYISEATFAELDCTEVEPGDLLVCRLAAPVGRACVAPDLGVRMITSVDVAILKPAPDVNAHYFAYLLSSAQYLGFMEGECRGGTRDRISRSFLGAMRVPKPPLSEQNDIVEALDAALAKLDTLATEARKNIALLRERRSALISAAVTGRIDVRGTAKPATKVGKAA